MQYDRWTTARIRPIICPFNSQKKWQCDDIVPSYEGHSDNYGSIFTRAYPIRRQASTRFLFSHYSKKMFPFIGQSVYWQSIFQKSPDPTFVLLTFIWHALYAWDEALEALYNHICTIVSYAIEHRMFTYSAHTDV